MNKSLENKGLFIDVPPLFVGDSRDAFSLINFHEFEHYEGEPHIVSCPDNWSREAAEQLSLAAFDAVPISRRAIEENTVPSWMWQQVRKGKFSRIETNIETSAEQIFNRVAGGATFLGWKQKLFAEEKTARIFYNELRFALAQRYIGLPIEMLVKLGLSWAYGAKAAPLSKAESQGLERSKAFSATTLHNKEIDAVVGGYAKAHTRNKWRKLTAGRKNASLTIAFPDIASDWGETQGTEPPALINLMAFRHNDGSVNIETLRHGTRLLVFMFDLYNEAAEQLAVGFCNLAPLLLALGIAYDSAAARATAAAISAIITAEAYAASAELAAMRGMSSKFPEHHEKTMRILRNFSRAAHGDHSDYEKLSVLPIPLSLNDCPDLALVAAAQNRWQDIIKTVQRYGLRQTHVTAMTMSPSIGLLMESSARGIEPIADLKITSHGRVPNSATLQPCIREALVRRGYDNIKIQNILDAINGYYTLVKAPFINHRSLRMKGFTSEALKRLENYLPNACDIRYACTPWVLGESFCRKALKIPSRTLNDPSFDLLHHLGFDNEKITSANAYCYGQSDLTQIPMLAAKDRPLFATGNSVSASARLAMAAAVQSFISGDVMAEIPLESLTPSERTEKLVLDAWRSGLRSVNFDFSNEMPSQSDAAKIADVAVAGNSNSQSVALRRQKSGTASNTSLLLHMRTPELPARKNRLKASSPLAPLIKKAGNGHAIKRVRPH